MTSINESEETAVWGPGESIRGVECAVREGQRSTPGIPQVDHVLAVVIFVRGQIFAIRGPGETSLLAGDWLAAKQKFFGRNIPDLDDRLTILKRVKSDLFPTWHQIKISRYLMGEKDLSIAHPPDLHRPCVGSRVEESDG
ncbi:MAG TPA: hypothetical protein VH164_12370 [Ktedonobacteraceae bacterium]|nr:hypothetical protein [Ktedonobacteraceae bacterium]